ncbi:MAG: RES domain-containing protein [Bacteroidetes bacterium CHB5]|nr:RES domain-containing protein [Bacteroidetes bacterium CHB5]
MLDESRIRNFIRKYQAGCLHIRIEEICEDVRSVVSSVPFMIVSLKNEVRLERVRNNYGAEIFTNEHDISFRRDLKNIAEYGRANLMYESVFYGSMFPKDIAFARITNILETNKILKSGIKDHKGRHKFTTGQWEVVGHLNIVVLPFNQRALLNNYITRIEYERYMDSINSLPKRDQQLIVLLMNFLANEFGKDVVDHADYKLSAAFSHVFLASLGLDGIIYPSRKAEFKSYNIALKPSAVDNIKLLKAGLYELDIDGTQVGMNMLAYAIDLGSKNMEFVWIPSERKHLSEILKLE